jgi:hypothetical protein
MMLSLIPFAYTKVASSKYNGLNNPLGFWVAEKQSPGSSWIGVYAEELREHRTKFWTFPLLFIPAPFMASSRWMEVRGHAANVAAAVRFDRKNEALYLRKQAVNLLSYKQFKDFTADETQAMLERAMPSARAWVDARASHIGKMAAVAREAGWARND